MDILKHMIKVVECKTTSVAHFRLLTTLTLLSPAKEENSEFAKGYNEAMRKVIEIIKKAEADNALTCKERESPIQPN